MKHPSAIDKLAPINILLGALLVFGGFCAIAVVFIAEGGQSAVTQPTVDSMAATSAMQSFILVLGVLWLGFGAWLLAVGAGMMAGKGWTRNAAIFWAVLHFVLVPVTILVQLFAVNPGVLAAVAGEDTRDAAAAQLTMLTALHSFLGAFVLVYAGGLMYILTRPEVKAYFAQAAVDDQNPPDSETAEVAGHGEKTSPQG